MQQPPWPGSAPSLDQVVRHATVRAGHREVSRHDIGASMPTLFATATADTIAVAANVSQLAAEGSAQATALSQTATVHALRALCHTFVARYTTGGQADLATDTAWWSSEAARLHTTNAGSGPSRAAAIEAPPTAIAGWSDFMRHATEVVESTHHIAAGRRYEDATATPSVSQRPRPNAAGDVNVLQLGGSTTNGAWESLEMLESAELGNGASSSSPGMHRDEAALRVIERAVHGGTSSASEEAEMLGSLAHLLKLRPELVAQHEAYAELQRWLIDCVCRHADPEWADAAMAFFLVLPPRAQLDFTHAAIAAVTGWRNAHGNAAAVAAHMHVLRLLQRILGELHQVWLPLLDSEVTELFLQLVDDVLVPCAALFEEVDPYPVWLSQWASRPSFVLTIDTLIRTRLDLVHALVQQLPRVHAAVVLLLALPLLSVNATAAPSPSSAQWQDVFHRFLRLLCSEALIAPAVLEVAAHQMELCVCKLAPADKADVFEAASAVMLRWPPSEAARQRDAQFVFALRLLTRLLVEPGDVEPWCSSPMWQVVDTKLFPQARALVRSRRERPPLSTPELFVASTLDVTAVVRQCWAQLLRARADRLPQALAASVQDGWSEASPPAKVTSLLSCRELVQVSTTLPGWAALRLHVAAAAGDATHASAWWSDLLAAIIDVGGGAGAAPPASSPPAPATAAAAAAARRRGKSKRRSHCCLRTLTPRAVALLLRWATCRVARDGLCEAARAASLAFLRTTAHAPHRRTRWPLLWPVESYPSAGPADLSATEDDFDHASATRAGACYQSVLLLLRGVAVSSSSSSSDDAEFFEESWGQLTDLWLGPAQESPDAALREKPVNRPPFGETSLLTLLAITALCVLARPAVEYRAWLDPGVAEPRIRQLRRLCAERRGVDPVYFMVRFITSGKGRKRLPAILLDGVEAELTVDTVCNVEGFTEGEELPAGDLATAGCTVQEAQELLTSALGPSPMSSVLAPDVTGTSPPADPVLMLVQALLANRAALRVTAADVEQCLARRDAEEWASFADADARVLAVCALLEQQYPTCVALLASGHMDVVFLVSLCLRSWLELPVTHSTPARRKLCWAALQYFCDHGVAAYDGLVARSIATHVEKSQRECASVVKEAVVFPTSRTLPLPSALFVVLLVRPFSFTMS